MGGFDQLPPVPNLQLHMPNLGDSIPSPVAPPTLGPAPALSPGGGSPLDVTTALQYMAEPPRDYLGGSAPPSSLIGGGNFILDLINGPINNWWRDPVNGGPASHEYNGATPDVPATDPGLVSPPSTPGIRIPGT